MILTCLNKSRRILYKLILLCNTRICFVTKALNRIHPFFIFPLMKIYEMQIIIILRHEYLIELNVLKYHHYTDHTQISRCNLIFQIFEKNDDNQLNISTISSYITLMLAVSFIIDTYLFHYIAISNISKLLNVIK